MNKNISNTIQTTCMAIALLLSVPSADAYTEGVGFQGGDVELGAYGGILLPDTYGSFIDGSSVDADPGHLIGGRIGYFLSPIFSIEGAYHHSFAGLDVGPDIDIDSTRLNLLANYNITHWFIPFITVGGAWEKTRISGLNAVRHLINDHAFGFQYGAGFRFAFFQGFGLRFDWRAVHTDVGGIVDSAVTNTEFTGGLFWSPLRGKKPKKAKQVENPDSDGDGIANGLDRCPQTAFGVKVDRTGCAADTDKDGVADHQDKCPQTKAGVAVDRRGCDSDKDGDNVANAKDKCPNTPKGAPVDEVGCAKDSDGDRVADYQDRCPGTAADTQVDANGCPKQTASRGVLKGVNFKSGTTELTPNAKVVLNSVAADLSKFPEVLVEVQGHTDSVGDANFNQRLSERRAWAVVNYLVTRGIPRQQLGAAGYGEYYPIADNASGEGRQANRRVELKWLDKQPAKKNVPVR